MDRVIELNWSPGTGSALDLVISGSGSRWTVCWMHRGGSGGGSVRFAGCAPDADYIDEKMGLGGQWRDDARAIWFLCDQLVKRQPKTAADLGLPKMPSVFWRSWQPSFDVVGG